MITGGTTRGEAVRRLRQAFAAAGLPNPGLDARLLAGWALGIEAAELLVRPEALVGPEEAARLDAAAARRLAREPVARILGEQEFWGLPFRLSPETLVPRADSETVVEAALAATQGGGPRILDLGTGSGCLLVALLHERREAVGLGVDLSLGALRTARVNADANAVGDRAGFVQAAWGTALRGPFELIVSNPPYIPGADILGLEREVSGHDPHLALDGGADGLAAYRAILADAVRLLAPGAHLVLELGAGQAEAVAGLAADARLDVRAVRADLAGRPRAMVLQRGGDPLKSGRRGP